MLQTLEKIDAQYEAELARKAQAANEIQPVVESENIPSDAVSSQYPGESNAIENNDSKIQNCSIIMNQEAAAASVNTPVTPSVPIPAETDSADSECKEGMLKSIQFSI